MKKRFITFMGLSKWIGLAAFLILTLALVFGNASHANANGVLLDREWLPVEPVLGAEGTEASVQVEQQGSIYVEPTISFTFAGTWIDELEIDHKKFQQLRVPGCGATGEVGQPEMPFKGIFLEIPYGVEVEVQILGQETLSLGTGYRVYPVQEPMPDLEGAPEPPFAFDAEAYAANRFFPESPIEVEAPAFIREKRVVFVKIFPMTYNPAMGELIGYKNLSFRLVWRGEIDPRGIKEKQRLRSRFFKPLPNELLGNYTPEASPEVDALNDAAAGGISTPVDNETENSAESELSTTTAADYLIIVYDTFSDEILPLANWKNRMGYVTRVVNMSTVGTTYSDVMTYIQNAYNTWNPAPSFVLLVGDYNQVPPHNADIIHPHHGTSNWPTDHTYACTSGSDYYPDLAIGRLSVGTEAECTTVVNKILEYERTPNSGTWWDDALIAALFQDRDGTYTVKDGTADRWFMETATHILDYLEDTVGYDIETAQCTDYWPLEYTTFHYRSSSYPHRPIPPDPVPTEVVNRWTSASQSTSDVTTAINGGVGVVVHRDHGGYTSWGRPPYSVSNVNALTNGDMTPVVFSMNCLTGAFDYSYGDCFAEAFQKKSGGGASGVVAASRVSYSGYNDLLAHGLLTSFCPDYDSSYTNTTYPNSWRVAEALNFAKYYMYTYEGSGTYTEVEFKLFHWFGDPSMMMRTVSPQTLTVSHDSTISQSATSFTVNVTQDGALVALEQDGNVLGTATSSGGSATVGISTSLSTSTVYVTVTNHDYLPYEVTVTISGETTASISDAWWIHEIDEDGDGYISSMSLAYQPVVNGEGSLTVDLKFYKKLKSSSTWSLFYTISDWEITGTSCWGWTAMTGGNHDEYDWKIEIYRSGISTPDYTRDPSNDGDLNDYKMETPSQDQGLEPDLSYLTHEIDDDNSGGSSGNGDGAVNPGETIELILTLENTGSAHAHNVSAQLSTSDAYVTISDADENYGDIAAGYTGSCQADYDFTVASSCPDGHVVTFNLNIQSDEGSWSDSFQITVTTVVAGRATKQILSVYSGEHAVHPRCSPDGTKISYGMYSSTEGFEIWVMNSYGSGSPKKIVSDAFPEDWMDDYHLFLSSSWSPDGEKIAYTKGEGTSPSETLDIWTINSDGSGIPLQITTTGKAIMPSWSPDGKKIAYLSDANDQIWVVNSDGTGTPEQITNSGDICVWPSWSPDGKKIAYTSFIWETGETDLWVGNSDGTGNPLKIVSDVFLPSSIDDHVLCAVTSWSPDGAKICYFSDGGIEGNHGIWVTNSDGSGTPQPITSNTNDGSWSPSCCSDGTKIVYSIYHNPGPGEYFSDLHMTDYLYGDDAFPAGNIVSPILNQQITGIYDVIGTITDNISVDGTTILSSFSSWTLEYGEGEEPETWTNIVTSSTYKSNELLASWDTSALALETYTLRLRATDGVDENVQSVTVLRIGHEPDITVTDSIAPADDLGLPFGEVQEGDFSEATVTMTNDGTADLAIYDIASANPLEAPFSIESDTCSNETVPPGASCSLTVRFNPDTTDTFSDSFDIPSNDPDEDSVIINLSGTCTVDSVADFSADPNSGTAPLTVNFTDLSTGSITDWAWDFGDGGTSAEQNPSHIYDTPGAYTVSLTVTGPGGTDTETKIDYITVNTEGWEGAYDTLFRHPSDLTLLRQYRDEFLIKTPKGKLYTKLLYNRSEKALQVLLRNPELMMEAKHLIEANKGAVTQVLNGNEGVIYNTDEIVSFLKAYARKAPPGLKLLAIAVEKEMLRQQRQGEKFLGFWLE